MACFNLLSLLRVEFVKALGSRIMEKLLHDLEENLQIETAYLSLALYLNRISSYSSAPCIHYRLEMVLRYAEYVIQYFVLRCE